MKKISVYLSGHRTSISLEQEFWAELQHIAKETNKPVAIIISQIDAIRKPHTNLSSAIRVWILQQTKKAD